MTPKISNYARPGFQSRHNRAYWENVPFLAFGNGAASYVDGHRFSRPRGLSEYDKWVDKLTHEGWSEATSTGAQVLPTVGAGILAGDDGPSDEAAERVSQSGKVCSGQPQAKSFTSRCQAFERLRTLVFGRSTAC